MKIFLLIFLLISGIAANSQPLSESRYSIELPKEWKPTPKFILQLTDIIRTNIPVLQKKDECLGCKADYTVRFSITEATVDHIYYNPPTNDSIVLYRFGAYMDVLNKKMHLIHRVILNDTSFTHSARRPSNIYAKENQQNFMVSSPSIMSLSPVEKGKNQAPPVGFDRLNNAFLNNRPVDVHKRERTIEPAPAENELWDVVRSILINHKIK
ncbi:MAG TPA: hypothetical protein VGD26_00500 [Chitinophagaceae bacterium]